jgi:hypothetical protein
MLVQQPCFLEAARNASHIFFPPKGLPADVFGECVIWVDPFKLLPYLAGLLDFA